MIKVVYLRAGDHHTLSITGHAGYAEHGNDIVCAGVSAISFALLGWLNNAGCDISAAQVDSGEMKVTCKGIKEAATAFDMAMVGLGQIAKKYPQHVDVYIAAPGG